MKPRKRLRFLFPFSVAGGKVVQPLFSFLRIHSNLECLYSAKATFDAVRDGKTFHHSLPRLSPYHANTSLRMEADSASWRIELLIAPGETGGLRINSVLQPPQGVELPAPRQELETSLFNPLRGCCPAGTMYPRFYRGLLIFDPSGVGRTLHIFLTFGFTGGYSH